MCCICSYLWWTIDFIQRLWTFLMTCCIGGTVFILLVVASLAGIAFGYNYSVSEYYRFRGTKNYLMVSRNLSANKNADNKIHLGQDSTNQSENINLIEDSNVSELTEDEIPNSDAFESEDQIKYENSLSSSDPWDVEMDTV